MPLSNVINPKVDVIAWMEFELVNYDVTVQYVEQNPQRLPLELFTYVCGGSSFFLLLHTYIYWIHTDAMITDARIKDAGRKTQEDFFTTYLPLTLFVRFAFERMLETEHKLHILTPLLWPSRCVFLVLLMLGVYSIGAFRGPPRSGVAFPTTSGL